MSKMVTVEQLAKDSGISVEKLLERLSAAGLGDLTAAHEISEDDKKKLLGSARGSSISLRRQSVSALKLSGGQGKTVQVKVVKQRRYVKKPEVPVEPPVVAAPVEEEVPPAVETPVETAPMTDAAPLSDVTEPTPVVEETAKPVVPEKEKEIEKAKANKAKAKPEVKKQSVADQQAKLSSSEKEGAKPKKGSSAVSP